ncbi:hypothetical protein FPV67DRAFT_1776331 [Lyophyllum atratum]|nr:hypothetical protein FPV67DRAFT_1776331 [Lyophyllum atratum]
MGPKLKLSLHRVLLREQDRTAKSLRHYNSKGFGHVDDRSMMGETLFAFRLLFLNPSAAGLSNWQKIPSTSRQIAPPKRTISATQLIVFPAATLEAASRRISVIYKNIIFDDGPDEEQFDGQDGEGVEAAHFPNFEFSLNLISPSSLSKSSSPGSWKVAVLLAALEVEGPDAIWIKKGAEAGNEISMLALILGDEEAAVCKLTAWREIADACDGAGNAVGVKRGDILLIENVMAAWDTTASPTLTASTHHRSKVEICYLSDAGVRKVAAVMMWFEDMAGLGAALFA